MKRKIILLSIFIIGCTVQNGNVNKTPEPVVSKSPSSSPIVNSDSLIPSVSPTTPVYVCDDNSFENKKLNFPYKISVTKDGKFVYVINAKYRESSDTFITKYLHDLIHKNNYGYNIIKNNIYKISDGNKLEIVDIDKKINDNCSKFEDLELDSNDNLYFVTSKHLLYLLNKDNILLKVSDLLKYDYNCPGGQIGLVNCQYTYQIPGNLYYSDSLYLLSYYSAPMSGNSGDFQINKIDITGKKELIYKSDQDMYIPFSFYKNILYIIEDHKRENIIRNFSSPFPIDFENKSIGKMIYPLNLIRNSKKNVESFFHGNNISSDDSLFFEPNITEMAINSKGEIFLNDLNKHLIWKIIPELKNDNFDFYNGIYPLGLRIFAGNYDSGYKDGKGMSAQFSYPTGLSFDAQDNLYVADTGNHAIRKITQDGLVSTFYKEK